MKNNNMDIMAIQANLEMMCSDIAPCIPDVEKAINALQKGIDSLNTLCDMYQILSHKNETEDAARQWEYDMERRTGNILYALDRAYCNIYEMMQKAKKIFPLEEDIPDCFDVRVVIKDGKIYARTPPLFNRNVHYFHTKSGTGVMDYFRFYGPILADKMMEIDMADYPLDAYKNVDLLAVYPIAEKNIPDTNNLDDKTVVDAILRPSITGDDATFCSFSSASIRSDVLKPGAYFSVTPHFGVRPNIEETVRIMTEIFPKIPDKT